MERWSRESVSGQVVVDVVQRRISREKEARVAISIVDVETAVVDHRVDAGMGQRGGDYTRTVVVG